ncbi:hypothetical protein NM688_g66 [Phlebia brevispora]|uniref:Uncharacterized protein n=1 Tax=Phlebia brevispora TaxID=194682 RepID=A0ACC1TF92_9APHY|nr:hypothetical protein NM688_g66 [Phlebia brevispora]
MLAAAASFLGRTNISQSYNIGAVHNGSRSGTPAPVGTQSALPPAAHATPFHVGPWRVQPATHKVTGKRVSVWSADKRSTEIERMNPVSRERVLEVLKAEASALSRLRHPSILEMVEPLEETRSELIFATEPVLSSLHLSIPGSLRHVPLVELDEVEIQKGILQLCKGLTFLHDSARLIHTNITPESILINSAGDWKISGLGLTIPISRPDGTASHWEFPTFDGRLPHYTQRSFDYIAPEYALDEVLHPASDMYSLGCLIYAVHCKGSPPFKNHGSIGGLRDNAGKPLTGMERLDPDLRGLRIRKILPSLLEEMKDTQLLPYILPNVFAISQILSPPQFASLVLPSLKPLFAIKEPPQNMITLLDNLQMLQNKTEKLVFREHVLPLVYNALESDHAVVQERALKAVPDLCETIDYAEVQGVLFPRVALVFTKTRILSVKVATLTTFLSMVKTLDQSSLTQKLVPLLAKIRTKEPAVMMSTLAVHEAMGMKVDREAVATLVLPQLWAMSMGPLLSVSQFKRFMEVIKKLGDRVEREHDQYLRDSQRIEDRSATSGNGTTTPNIGAGVDFETLVAGGSAAVKADTTIQSTPGWEDDVWGSIFNGPDPVASPPMQAPVPPAQQQSMSLPSSPLAANSPPQHTRPHAITRSSRGLGATPISSSSFNSSAFSPPTQSRPSLFTPARSSLSASNPLNPQPQRQPTLSQSQAPPAPNYNISLPPAPIMSSASMAPMTPLASSGPMASVMPTPAAPPVFATNMGGILAPSRPAQPSWPTNGTAKQLSKDDWGDFDPLA